MSLLERINMTCASLPKPFSVQNPQWTSSSVRFRLLFFGWGSRALWTTARQESDPLGLRRSLFPHPNGQKTKSLITQAAHN